MCGKGIIFIDTFHTIRVKNFAVRAGYATFPPRGPLRKNAPNITQNVEVYEVYCTINDILVGITSLILAPYRATF